jgi:hypothetical protein
MIHYHGLPITPTIACLATIRTGHAFVSHRYKDQLGLALEVCQSFAIDNGAFSAWRSGVPVSDWSDYYSWVAELCRHPSFDFAVIPDEVDGDEQANDALLDEWPWRGDPKGKWIGAPVWHMHESVSRLRRLAIEWPRVCLGSSGEYASVGTKDWWGRIGEAMKEIVDGYGTPICKLHGLRMLNPKVFTRIPLSSADSTNVARNIGLDVNWRGTKLPPNKEARAAVMRARIETHNSCGSWNSENKLERQL